PAHRQVRRFGDVRPAAQLQGQAGLCRQHRRAQPEGAAHWRRRPISRSADIAAVDTGAAASAGGSARLSTATLHQQPDQRRTGDRQLLQQRRHHGRSGVGGTDHPALGFAPERETMPPEIALAYASAFKEPRAPAPQVYAPRWTAWGGAYGGSNRTTGDTAIVGSHDLSANTAGVASGLHYRPTPGTLAA